MAMKHLEKWLKTNLVTHIFEAKVGLTSQKSTGAKLKRKFSVM